ncbi:MAG: hypothetical protein ACLSHX_18220 [Suilimivivens sp.]
MKAEAREDNRGTSMITVIISFALLMIFVTAFFKVQKVSQNMMMDARDMQINNRKLVESFYLSQMQDSAASGDGKLVFSGKEGSFYIDAALYRAQKDGLFGVIYYYGTEEKTAEEGAETGEEAEE